MRGAVLAEASTAWNIFWVVMGAIGLVLFVLVLRWWNAQKQRMRDAQAARVENDLVPRLGGVFHRDDTDRLVDLPFVAFTQWATASRTVNNIVTFSGPLGCPSHAFDFEWVCHPRNGLGNDVKPFTDGHAYTPDRFNCVGTLIGLPQPVVPLTATSFPRRGGASAVTGTSKLLPLPVVPPGSDARVAFDTLFVTGGDPAWLARLLNPAVVDGLLRGPPGIHVELWDRWMLTIAYAPWSYSPQASAERRMAVWATWFATLVPLDQITPPPPA